MYRVRLLAAIAVVGIVVWACGGTSVTTEFEVLTTDETTTTVPAPTSTQGATTTTGVPSTTAPPDASTSSTTTTTLAPATTTTTMPARPAIEVRNPKANTTVASPLFLAGHSNTADGMVYYRLVGGDDIVLAEGSVAGGTDGEWLLYEVEIDFANSCCIEGTLDVFEVSGVDGTEINKVTIPVAFNAPL